MNLKNLLVALNKLENTHITKVIVTDFMAHNIIKEFELNDIVNFNYIERFQKEYYLLTLKIINSKIFVWEAKPKRQSYSNKETIVTIRICEKLENLKDLH